MFRGRHDHAIDAKGRLSIPAGFRNEILRRSESPPILTTDRGCLALYPFDEWQRFEHKLTDADQLRPEVQSLTRFFFANAVEAPFDKQGRILIPKYLRDHAGLERDVTVAGMGSRIELWNKDELDLDLRHTYENLDSMRAAFAAPGSR